MPIAALSTGVDIYFDSYGAGEPLVFIPGTGFAGNVWNPSQVETLSREFRVIVPDPRGCGRSSKPAGVYSIDQMGCDVAALLDHLQVDAAHVIGHSMGGRIALALALAFPRKVKSLVLAASGSGPAGRDGPDCVPGLPYFLVHELVEMGFDRFLKQEICETHTYFTDRFRRDNADFVERFYDMVVAHHAKVGEYLRLCMARHMWEGTHRLSEISAPCLVLVGDDDSIGSSHLIQSKILAERLPHSEFLLLPDQSHGFFWQAPAEANEIVAKFVRKCAH